MTDMTPVVAADVTSVVRLLREEGLAVVRLRAEQRSILRRFKRTAHAFFSLPRETKERHRGVKYGAGYRPYRSQYSQVPERPDLCESFALWGDDSESIPGHREIDALVSATKEYRALVAIISRRVLEGIAESYGSDGSPQFERNSCVEVNHYTDTSERELLQDLHEDGHLLTLLNTDGPGLEIMRQGKVQAALVTEGDVLLMPGKMLTLFTGGDISPLYHRVRNHHLPERMTALYQVNPDLSCSVIRPFKSSGPGQLENIVRMAREVGQGFGLPPAPI